LKRGKMETSAAVATRRSKLFAKLFLIGSPLILVLGVVFIASNVNDSEAMRLEFLSGAWPVVYMAALIIILLALWVSSAIAGIAARKGRSWGAFFGLSLLFPLLMWIIASVMSTDNATVVNATKKCPKCAEDIKAEATICRYCSHTFETLA